MGSASRQRQHETARDYETLHEQASNALTLAERTLGLVDLFIESLHGEPLTPQAQDAALAHVAQAKAHVAHARAQLDQFKADVIRRQRPR